jgi:hypothetical protein
MHRYLLTSFPPLLTDLSYGLSTAFLYLFSYLFSRSACLSIFCLLFFSSFSHLSFPFYSLSCFYPLVFLSHPSWPFALVCAFLFSVCLSYLSLGLWSGISHIFLLQFSTNFPFSSFVFHGLRFLSSLSWLLWQHLLHCESYKVSHLRLRFSLFVSFISRYCPRECRFHSRCRFVKNSSLTFFSLNFENGKCR